jgi:hypothetical protein
MVCRQYGLRHPVDCSVRFRFFCFGFDLNIHSDAILRNLRSKHLSPDTPRYKIPYDGGVKFFSVPEIQAGAETAN